MAFLTYSTLDVGITETISNPKPIKNNTAPIIVILLSKQIISDLMQNLTYKITSTILLREKASWVSFSCFMEILRKAT